MVCEAIARRWAYCSTDSSTALCPVNLRDECSEVGVIIAGLVVAIDDPIDQLEAIHASTLAAKKSMRKFSQL